MATSAGWPPAVRPIAGIAAGAFLALAAVAVQSVSGLAAGNLAATTDQAVTYQVGATHSGSPSNDTLTPPLTLGWSTTLGAPVSYPLIANGHVFVTTGSNTTGTKLYALNLSNGSIAWGPITLGGTYWNATAAYDGGRVFSVNYDGKMQAFDENSGSLLWTTQLPGQYSFSSPPSALNGIVYTGGAGSGGTVYAVRESDGTVLWTGSVMNGDNSSPAVTASGVYVSYACAQTYDFNPTSGALIWHHSTTCEGGGGKTPVLANGNLYVRDAIVGNAVLDAATGNSVGTFSANRAPAITTSRGYFLNGSTLTAIDLGTNATLWSFAGDGALSSAPIVVNGYVYVGSTNGNLYALDQSGNQAWTTNVGSPINAPDEQNVSQPITGLGAGDGYLVVPAGNTVNLYNGQESLYPGDAIWGSQPVGQAAASASFSLVDNTLSPLQITSIAVSGDYTQTNNCPASLTPGASCLINVTFTPSTAGTRSGALTVTDNAAGSPHAIALSGTGIVIGPADHLVLTPASATITAGASQAFKAEAFDKNNYDLGDVTGSTTFSLDGATAGCSANTCTTTIAGSHTVSGQYQAASGSTTLNVTGGALDHMTISPATATVTVGSTQTYSVEGFDQYGNDLGPVTTGTLAITPDGACYAAGCTPAKAGPHTVTVTNGSHTATASLTANPGPPSSLTLTPATATITAGAYQVFQAEAYDAAGDDLGDVTSAATWSVNAPGITGCNGSSCSSTVSGTQTVTAVYQQAKGTALLNVNPGPVSRIRLSPTNVTMTAGGSQAFSARTVDAYENTIADVTAATTFVLSPNGSCSANVCTAPTQATTNANVTGTYNGMNDVVNVVVSPGPLDHTTISPTPSTITAGQSQTYTVIAYDQYNNYVGAGNVTSASTFAITPDGSCSASTCTATKAGAHSVTATYQGKTATASLTVNPGAAATLTLSPAGATITAGASQSYTTTAADQYGNSLGDVTASTAFWVDVSTAACSQNMCSSTKAGSHQVVGSYQSVQGTSALTVNAGPATTLTVSPARLTLTVGQAGTLTASGSDAYGNAASTSSAVWSVSSTTLGSLAPSTGTSTTLTANATTSSTGVVTAKLGTLTASSTVSVVPAAPTKLVATSNGGHKANLTWSGAAGATSYTIYRSTGSSGWSVIKTGVTSTSYTDSGLTAGQTYNYYVVGVAGSLSSGPSNTASVVVKG